MELKLQADLNEIVVLVYYKQSSVVIVRFIAWLFYVH